MICTVSTIKDTAEHIETFVERNLAAGADHLFVFLDGEEHGVAAQLRDRDCLTVVVTDDEYWQGDRLGWLNGRQRVNANLVNQVLAGLEFDTWLFHLDGDECLEIDRDELEDLPEGTRYVRLEPREAVSQREQQPDTCFKRLLDRSELALLVALDVIPQPRNTAYFHGHVVGKPGLRPDSMLRLHLHDVTTPDGVNLEPHRSPALRMLHYESDTAAEFVRKWSRHVSGNVGGFRGNRAVLHRAVGALLRNEALDDGGREQLLLELYSRWVEDDLPLLRRLGFASPADAGRHHYRPRPLGEQQRRELQAQLEKALGQERRALLPARRQRVSPRGRGAARAQH